jgi:hypothetical protein
MPAFLAVIALCLRQAGRLDELFRSSIASTAKAICAVGLAFLFLLLALQDRNYLFYYPQYSHGDKNYSRVIEIAKNLPGTVICPDDNTIPLRAKGFDGNNYSFEYEKLGAKEGKLRYGPDVAGKIISGCAKDADYVVLVESLYTGDKSFKEEALRNTGFSLVTPRELEGSAYSIWKRPTSSLKTN